MPVAEPPESGPKPEPHGLTEAPTPLGFIGQSFKFGGRSVWLGGPFGCNRTSPSGASEPNRNHGGRGESDENQRNPYDTSTAGQDTIELTDDPAERSSERTDPVTDPRQRAAKRLRGTLNLKPAPPKNCRSGASSFVRREWTGTEVQRRRHGASDDASTSRSKPSLRTRSSR